MSVKRVALLRVDVHDGFLFAAVALRGVASG